MSYLRLRSRWGSFHERRLTAMKVQRFVFLYKYKANFNFLMGIILTAHFSISSIRLYFQCFSG
jgi:hypothetical protein